MRSDCAAVTLFALLTALSVGAATPNATAPDLSERVASPGSFAYNFGPLQIAHATTGDVRVSAEGGAVAPMWGYALLRVTVENVGSRAYPVVLTFNGRGVGGSDVVRKIEAPARSTQRVNLAIPAGVGFGTLRVDSPGVAELSHTPIHFMRPPSAMLVIGSTEGFQRIAGGPDPNVYERMVRVIPPSDLPSEVAAYLGYEAIVVTVPLEELAEPSRRALEMQTAVGGTLILSVPSRAIASALPLLPSTEPGLHRYGFGYVRVCSDVAAECRSQIESDAYLAAQPVTPRVISRYTRVMYPNEEARVLLPQAAAPVGRFLLIMLGFTVAMGPGSVWIARRKGSPMLLLTIPLTAVVTCLLIVGWSVLVEGFAVHATTRGYTLLDSKNDRAITVGLGAFYANVAPSEVRLDRSTAVVGAADYQSHVTSIDWTDGNVLGADFIPSRTYREWGFVSVSPSRARLVVKHEGNEVVVQNALGADISKAFLRLDGEVWTVDDLQDGGRSVAKKAPVPERLYEVPAERFLERVPQTALTWEKEGEFVAVLEGPGFLPLGGLRLNHDGSRHLVRGEVTP